MTTPSVTVTATKSPEVDVHELGRRRQERSVPVLADIEALLLANLHAVLPKSLLGQALHYLAGQWPKLKRFVEDGRYSIDNNVQENAIRPFWTLRSLCSPSSSA